MAGGQGVRRGVKQKLHTHISPIKTNNTRFMSTAIQKLIGYRELGRLLLKWALAVILKFRIRLPPNQSVKRG